jgi:hypothetical protein
LKEKENSDRIKLNFLVSEQIAFTKLRFSRLIQVFILFSFMVSFILLPTVTKAQKEYTLSGTIKNAESGELLIGATILVEELKTVGVSSNSYGYYSLTLPEGTYTVLIRYLSFKNKRQTIILDKNLSLNFELIPEALNLDEVVVSGERANTNVTSTEMSVQTVEVKQLQSIPVLLGERDVLKTIQLMPGMKSAGEGSTGFYARGGRTDQNLILLDEATIYNAAHALGFVSIFNSDAIKDVKIMTAAIPAEYGGRLSSVLNIRTNDGNTKKFDLSGGIGLVASRLSFQGPIVENEGSFIFSARRTYADLFLKLSKDTTINRTSLYFYDMNLKANYSLGDKDHVYVSGYFGRDNFSYQDVLGYNWGNTTASGRWNHIFGDKFFSNISFIFSDYEYMNTTGVGTSQFTITSGIKDLNFKADFEYFINPQNTMKFGLNSIHHTLIPGSLSAGTTSTKNTINIERRYALENSAYATYEQKIGSQLNINYGVRFSSFILMGPGHIFTYDNSGDPIDSTIYSSGQIIKTFSDMEPRIMAALVLNEFNSIKASYARTVQYLHLLSNSTITNPNDLWVASSNNIKPQYADQIALGYFRNFSDNGYETSLEIYYKNMQNLIDYKNGADLQLNPNVESQLEYGRGWSYGAEFMIKKKFGDLTGWIGYTLSRTEEQYSFINNGKPFPARQDRTHDISIVAMYNYNKIWSFSATWVYNTGNAVTFPSGNYLLNGRLVPYYTERNGYRMPAYHRLDLSATYTISEKSNLNFSLYNAYDRMNPYAIFFRQNRDNPTKTEAVQVTLFPIIPAITYNFKF